MAREHCFYEDIFNYLVHGSFWTDSSDTEKDKLRRESTNYSVIQGNLFHVNSSTKKLQQVIVNESDQKRAILECHIKEDTGDHLNVKSTCFNLRKRYHWKNMDNDVNKFVKSCQECGFGKGDAINSESKESKEFLDRVWKLVEVDIIGPLQFCEKQMFLLRLTDVFSKWMSYNLLSEINFKDISNILLQEFSVVGFPLGIRLVGVENSEKLVDTFEIALKDFMENVNKINLLFKEENEQSESPVVSDCKESMPKDNDNNENVQSNVDSGVLNMLENVKINHTSEKNDSASVNQLDIKDFDNGCEINNDSSLEQNSKAKDDVAVKNCEDESDMESKVDGTTGELKTKNYENGDDYCGKTNDVSIPPQMKNFESDIEMLGEENLTTESERKNCENDNHMVDSMRTDLEMKDFENDVESSKETKIINTNENDCDITTKSKIVTSEQESANGELSTEVDDEAKVPVIESETESLNHQSNNKNEASQLQQNSLPKNNKTQSLTSTKELESDINANTPVLLQNKIDNSYKPDAVLLNNTPLVKRIKDSENMCEELGDFEMFLKSSEENENCLRPSLYVFLVQQSLLDSETQNVCRTYLQKFIKLFPDSWTNNLSYFNFLIRNSLSTSFQTPSQLLLHRDPYLLRLCRNRSLNKDFQPLRKEIFHEDNRGKGSQGSPENKHMPMLARDGYSMRSLSTSTSVRRHSRYGLRKSPKPKDSPVGFSEDFVKPQKRPAGEDEKQKDTTPPLKSRKLSSYHSKRISAAKQKAIDKTLENYSLKSPIIVLRPLPCFVVDSVLLGKTDLSSWETF